jgi:hypothetical protein
MMHHSIALDHDVGEKRGYSRLKNKFHMRSEKLTDKLTLIIFAEIIVTTLSTDVAGTVAIYVGIMA